MTSTKSNGRPSDRFSSALRALRRSLDEMGIPFAIIGGIAINANGIARFTEDVDATIPGAGLDLDRLVRTLGKNRIAARAPDVVEFARENQVLLLHHVPSGIDLDLSLAWIAFELDAIEHALDLRFGSARIRAARPEDLLIYKLPGCLGRGASPSTVSLGHRFGSRSLGPWRDLRTPGWTGSRGALEGPHR